MPLAILIGASTDSNPNKEVKALPCNPTFSEIISTRYFSFEIITTKAFSMA